MIDPITGMVVAQGVGGALSAFGNMWGADRTGEIQERIARRQIQEQRDAYNEVRPEYDPYLNAGRDAVSQLAAFDPYGGAMQGQFERDMNGNVVGLKQFDGSQYGNDQVGNYLDPSMAFQQEQMRRQVQASAMGRGSMLSGSAMKELQDRSAQLAQTDYANSWQRMQTDKNFAYQQYLNDFTNSRVANQDMYNKLNTLTNVGQNAVSGVANLRTGVANQVTAGLQNLGNAQSASASAIPSFISGVGNAVGTGGQAYAQYDLLNKMYPPQQKSPWSTVPNPAGSMDQYYMQGGQVVGAPSSGNLGTMPAPQTVSDFANWG